MSSTQTASSSSQKGKSASAASTGEQTKSKGKRGLGVVKKKGDSVYLILNKDVEIYVKGEKTDLGEYRTLFFDSVQQVLANVEKREAEGTISEKAAETLRSICSNEGVKYLVDVKLA
jgi:hypothetical protein